MESGYLGDCLDFSKQLEPRNKSVFLANGIQNTVAVSANSFHIYTSGKQTVGIFHL